MNSNERKAKLLGEPFGTANGRLRKLLIFRMAQRLGDDICIKCENKIEKIEDFSIEHIIPWGTAENPKEAFYDLENVRFSHLSCNIADYKQQSAKRICKNGHKIEGDNNYRDSCHICLKNKKKEWKKRPEYKEERRQQYLRTGK